MKSAVRIVVCFAQLKLFHVKHFTQGPLVKGGSRSLRSNCSVGDSAVRCTNSPGSSANSHHLLRIPPPPSVVPLPLTREAFFVSRETVRRVFTFSSATVGAIFDRPPKNTVFRISQREISLFRLAATDFRRKSTGDQRSPLRLFFPSQASPGSCGPGDRCLSPIP